MTAISSASSSTYYPLIVAPSFNNAQTLPDILNRLSKTGLPVAVVNDGSTDDTASILREWQSKDDSKHQVLTHAGNRGKAAALRTAFEHAASSGFTHVVTIDTDGQLSPEDITPLLEISRHRPDALVIGVRDKCTADYPARSRTGRRVSNLLVWVESGVKVDDSQCGLRVYPLSLVSRVRCRAEHFGFETEIITRAGWAGVRVIGGPVSCRYLPPGQRVSHFKPWLDTLRAVGMHSRLIATAMNPLPRRAQGASFPSLPPHMIWSRFFRWMNPVTAWRQARGDTASRTRFAAGFATGVFIASLPLYGVQTLVSLFIARRLRLHPMSVVAGTNIAFPPIGPLMIIGGVALGHLLLHGSLPAFADYSPAHHGFTKILGPMLWEWLVGGVVLGAALAAVAFVGVDCILRAAASAGGWMHKASPEPVD